MAGRASVSRVTCPGNLGTWPGYSRVGHVAPSEACGGGAWVCMRGSESGPETGQPRLGQKPSPGGLPPVLPSVKGDPFTGILQGDLRGGGDWTVVSAGLPPRRPFTGTPAPCVRGPWRPGPLISGCRCPAVVKEWHGHSPGERGHLDHEGAPGKFPSPGHHGSRCFPRLLPWGLILLNWARVRRR